MVLLESSILFEMLKSKPDTRVAAWLAGQPAGSVFVSTIAEAELRQAAMFLSQRRRQEMLAVIEGIFGEDFSGRVLPFDRFAAAAYAQVMLDCRSARKEITQLDAMVAGIARSRGARLATRNADALLGCGVEVVDPWGASRES